MVADREVPGRGVWAQIVGPLVTLLVCGALWLLAVAGVRLVPAPFLCLAVTFAALRGRIVGGVVSVVITLAYAIAAPVLIGLPLGPPTLTDLVVLAVVLLGLVFLISSRVDWLCLRVESALRKDSLVLRSKGRQCIDERAVSDRYFRLRIRRVRQGEARADGAGEEADPCPEATRTRT